MLTRHGPQALAAALQSDRPLAETLLKERLAHLPPACSAQHEALQIVAARPPAHWASGTDHISDRLDANPLQVQKDLLAAVTAWDRDPRNVSQQHLQAAHRLKTRLAEAAAQTSAERRWAALAAELDPRLPHDNDWPALARALQEAHDQGRDVPATIRRLIAQQPLGDLPAQDLHDRLTSAPCPQRDHGHRRPAEPARGRRSHTRHSAPHPELPPRR